jgi:hypothetical protein
MLELVCYAAKYTWAVALCPNEKVVGQQQLPFSRNKIRRKHVPITKYVMPISIMNKPHGIGESFRPDSPKTYFGYRREGDGGRGSGCYIIISFPS